MANEDAKRRAARAAMEHVKAGEVIGVGTGSTVGFFIEALAELKGCIAGAVSSSEDSTRKLRALGIPVLDLNEVGVLSLYVDGADEVDPQLCLIKGGGGALTREKIIAACSTKFVCIVDPSKKVPVLGAFPLPVEVIPMARTHVAKELTRLGGRPVWREVSSPGTASSSGGKEGHPLVTDNGNHVLDVHGLSITDPCGLERAINALVGVVTVGLFAARPADVLLTGEL